MDYRHELKFLVSDTELEIIRYRLQLLMKPDAHQKNGVYIVRSLYFDDLYDSCMWENEEGYDDRKKYRIRFYNGDTDVIKLEKKMKYRDMTQKVSVVISKEACLSYIFGIFCAIKPDSTQLEKEFSLEIQTRGMHPVCIVEYERTAFVEPRGNVRITFDRNVSGNGDVRAFLDRKTRKGPLLEKGQNILEIKYDTFLPEYIFQTLQIGTLQRISFSKYYYARKYGIY